jgi:hypothetical protein
MSHGIHHSLIDDVMDAYVEWRQQSADVGGAYRRWLAAHSCDTTLAFAAYHAALDREEVASRTYASLIQRNRNLHAADLGPAARLREAA